MSGSRKSLSPYHLNIFQEAHRLFYWNEDGGAENMLTLELSLLDLPFRCLLLAK